jgi:plastocyanin
MRKLLASLAAVAAFTAACGGSSGSSSSTTTTVAAGPPVIKAVGTIWKPSKVHAKVGETVTWVVEKGLVHDLAGADGVKHAAGAEWTYTHTYSAPATYAFLCTLHAGMNGTVTVQ